MEISTYFSFENEKNRKGCVMKLFLISTAETNIYLGRYHSNWIDLRGHYHDYVGAS